MKNWTTNLHVMTAEGSLNSMVLTESLVDLKVPIISVVDTNMFGVVDFYRACKENGKKAVFSLDACLAFGDVEKLSMQYGQLYTRITLTALNRTGYLNLVRLATFSHREGLYQKPRIDLKRLEQYSGGLACLINKWSEPVLHFEHGNETEALRTISDLHVIFSNRLYYEMLINTDHFETVNVMKKLGCKDLASNVVLYLNREDFSYYNYLWAINNNATLYDLGKTTSNADRLYYLTTDEMKAFSNGVICDENIYNTMDFLNMVEDYKIDSTEVQMPRADVNVDEFVKELHGMLESLDIDDEAHCKRLEYELETITKFGYVPYFTVVKELVEYASTKLSGYLSAGRGSVGGCLVAYLLGITRIDPVNPQGFSMSIPFDRFLNSGRRVMPDIDMDFLPQDRADVIDHLREKYGVDSVKNIITSVTLGPRSALREVARISDKLTPKIEAILKSFPHDQQLSLVMIRDSDIYTQNKDDQSFVDMFQIAERLEGYPRSLGVHASGIALSNKTMEDSIPFYSFNGKEITQYNQDQLEYLGIIKLDVLGLTALQIINDTLAFMDIPKDLRVAYLNGIEIDDLEVYEFINSGSIAGVFQWDTHNYKTVIQRVKPNNFKELVDLNTLGRSAALMSGLTERYIQRKRGAEDPKPLHLLLAGMMVETWELPLYQEQIMMIFTKLANYSMAEADDVRKAIGKKIPELMMKQKVIFIQRCRDNDIDVRDAEEIWSIVDKFSKYTWNLGHAITYTRTCYETAWLAYHRPKDYYCACINNALGSDEVGKFISALKKRRIKVYNADINESGRGYKTVDGGVMAGFAGLRGVGDKTVDAMLTIREDGFESMTDFCKRVPKKVVNKAAIKSLFYSGALTSILITEEDQKALSDRVGDEDLNILRDQYQYSGRVVVDPIGAFTGVTHISSLAFTSSINTVAYLSDVREIYTKKGQKMAFLVIEDYMGRHEVTVFPATWASIPELKKGWLYGFVLAYSNGIVANSISVTGLYQ